MKCRLLALSTLVLTGLAVPAAAEEMLLIDGNLRNGSFEMGAMEGWSSTPKLAEAPQEVPSTEKHGSFVFPVKFMGQPGGRAVSTLLINLNEVYPDNGRNFKVQFDTKELLQHPAPSISVEIVVFGQDKGYQAITFQTESEESGDDEWTTRTLTSTTPIAEDWLGGKIQFRLVFYKDDGRADESYELLIDNVRLWQTRMAEK